MKRTIAIAITGASGALYATRTMAALLERGCHLELIVSDYGKRLLRDELGEQAAIDKLLPYLESSYGEGVRNGASLCVAQFRGPRKSLLKFGEGSESFSERFGGCRELLLGFLELLGNVVKLPINFCLTLRDFADLLQ